MNIDKNEKIYYESREHSRSANLSSRRYCSQNDIVFENCQE